LPVQAAAVALVPGKLPMKDWSLMCVGLQAADIGFPLNLNVVSSTAPTSPNGGAELQLLE